MWLVCSIRWHGCGHGSGGGGRVVVVNLVMERKVVMMLQHWSSVMRQRHSLSIFTHLFIVTICSSMDTTHVISISIAIHIWYPQMVIQIMAIHGSPYSTHGKFPTSFVAVIWFTYLQGKHHLPLIVSLFPPLIVTISEKIIKRSFVLSFFIVNSSGIFPWCCFVRSPCNQNGKY